MRISSAATRCWRWRASRPPLSADGWRSLKDYVGALKTNQTAIYYLAGDDIERLEVLAASRRVSAPAASRCCCLPDPVDSFWVMSGAVVRRQAVQIGDARRGRPGADPARRRQGSAGGGDRAATKTFLVFMKNTLGDAVAEVRASDRLTDSAVCLVASDKGPDRALEKLLAGAGRLNVRLEADPGSQSAPRTHRRARRARRRRTRAQGRRGASVVRRGARARRRSPGRRKVLFRAARARLGEVRGAIIRPRVAQQGSHEASAYFNSAPHFFSTT